MEKVIIKKSVREFVEFILRQGSLDNRFSNNARAIEGVRAHKKLQNSNLEIYKNYEKEVYLKTEVEMETCYIYIEGRADGIIIENDDVIVEEIKSTYTSLIEIDEHYSPIHWAQGKVYAYIVAKNKNLDEVYIQLSYYNLDTDEVKTIRKKFEFNMLKNFVINLASEYENFAKIESEQKYNRKASIVSTSFPFSAYRKGQLNLAKAVFGTIREEKKLFVQAPTGIGKTISTIFPAVKAVGDGYGERIFYLTAKGINRTVAQATFDKLRDIGLMFRYITLTAKDKICLNDKVSCNPDDCKYAKDYFNKEKDAIYKIIKKEWRISREMLIEYGEKYEICPFELSLGLILWCDGIICDYNYIFDPRVYLRRVLDENSSDNIILIDEGHNLIDRARNMYSASLNKEEFLNLRKKTKGKLPKLYSWINKINSFFIELRNSLEYEEIEYYYDNKYPEELIPILRSLLAECSEVLTKNKELSFYDELLELYFNINSFLGISDIYGDEYITYAKKESEGIVLSLFCVNPSEKLEDTMKKCRSTIIFSATLSPIEYYIKLLGGDEDDYRLRLESPFPKENLNVEIFPANTRYNYRDKTMSLICEKIISFIEEKIGNYFVFFPSYEYMEKAYAYISENNMKDYIVVQDRNMTEEDKEVFLDQFQESSNKVGLCVLGGIFSEGIDLPGSRLIGAVIVGVGYPKISIENEIISSYFGNIGDKYSYIYPGVNKIMQAVGRVIRTEEDRGRVLLIDDRYLNYTYSSLLPKEWK